MPAPLSTTELVPFTDLSAMAAQAWPSISADFIDTLLAGRYIGGEPVEHFERQWAAYCGTTYCVGVGNGTDAILLTLQALGIGPGDEVVVPASTFVATAEAVVRAGAVPRFADVSPVTLLLTPETLRAAITPRTRAVVVVHLYGQLPDMDALSTEAARAGIALVEDAAQAHGAQWCGRQAGSFGVAGCFSFYPGKNLGAFGDAGAVVTSDHELAERVRTLANHGRYGGAAHHTHDLLGTNSRLDALQAIGLSGKLVHLEEWTAARVARAHEYHELLADSAVRLIDTDSRCRHVYHLLAVRVSDRDGVRGRLAESGIQTGIHYPVPCHLQPPLLRYADGPLPVSEMAASELVSLPMFPHLGTDQVERVCAALLEAVRPDTGKS